MYPDRLRLAEILSNAQVAAGLVILAILLVTFYRSGRMRRAFAFPPATPTTISGAHMLLVLAAFLAATSLVSLTFRALGIAPPEPAAPPRVTATQTAPAQAGPEPGEGPDSTGSQPAESRSRTGARAGPALPDNGAAVAGKPLDLARDLRPPVAPEGEVAAADLSNPADIAPASSDTRPPTPDNPAASQPAPDPLAETRKLAAQAATETITLGAMLYVAHIAFAGGLAGFGLRSNRLGRDLFWAITGYLAFWPVCVGMAAVTAWLAHWLLPDWTPREHDVLVLLQHPGASWLGCVLSLLLAGLIAPLFEEVLFRGLALSWFRRASGSVWMAIVLTALAFGLNHHPQWHLVPALTVLGLVQGYLYARTGSLRLVILFHIIFNLRTLILVAVAGTSVP